MNNEQKQYVGGAKKMSGNFGDFHKISFSAQDIELLQHNLNAKGYVNLVMNERRTPSQYGQTHSITIDTWEPQQTGGAPQQPDQYQQQQPYQQQPAQPQYQAPRQTEHTGYEVGQNDRYQPATPQQQQYQAQPPQQYQQQTGQLPSLEGFETPPPADQYQARK